MKEILKVAFEQWQAVNFIELKLKFVNIFMSCNMKQRFIKNIGSKYMK